MIFYENSVEQFIYFQLFAWIYFLFPQGLAVVRAFRAEGRFFKMCCNRINDMNR